MYLQVFLKILSESLLSLYPLFVKYINIPIELEVWSRFFIYILISLFLINYKFIFNHLFSKNGILLSIITIIHVYSSYKGFELLDSGVAYTLFYLYPIFILLFSKEKFNYIILIAIIGVILLEDNIEEFKTEIFKKKDIKEKFKFEGITMMIIAAITEAIIFFIVKNIKTDNHWNHLFLSYFFGSVIFTILFFKKIKKIKLVHPISVSLFVNLIIGVIGYYLRFYSITKLNPVIYSFLSYFGILMAYIYGIILNNEKITLKKIIGTILILIPNLYLFNKKSD